MFTYIIRRVRRRPGLALAVLGLSLLLSFALCFMQYNYEREEKAYHETYSSIPVYLNVTDLSGMYTDGLWIPGLYYEVFSGSNYIEPRLSLYMKDVRAKICVDGMMGEKNFLVWGFNHEDLLPEVSISWGEGYGEGFFEGKDRLCIVPAELGPAPGDKITLTVYSGITHYDTDGNEVTSSYDHTLTVAGVHDGSESEIYVPYSIADDIAAQAARRRLKSLSATLADNYALEEFKELVPSWFAEPDPMGNRTAWSYGAYTYYPNALDIDDDLLQRAEDSLASSLLINKMASVLVFILSAGAGFFLGFLIIRSSKREISLMRTLGQSGGKIFIGLLAEQMVCVLLGTAIGGAAFLWQPTERLAAFAVMYFAGLCAALAVFLNRNLLQGQKEEE